ncbi:MAG: formate C-acetyltransferase/glycerol dehydratase family glycyl radical enzyme [Erysipelotrichaceae bacterium]|nr:formate C-acetyltransferase/glycerol dehydratase family glycyl radical enzyme [Erysipelotrichaceae bacterium]
MTEFLSFKPQNQDVDWERITRFQQRMNQRQATICAERAELITQAYQTYADQPPIIKKALALDLILTKMTIYIDDDSLIIGNHASVNFAAPIFPEYSFNWVIEELDDFADRSGDCFTVSDDVKARLRRIQPYWQNITHQDEVRANMSETNQLAAQQAVLHRGGISMSGDGHIVPNHQSVMQYGFGGLARQAAAKRSQNGLTSEQRDFYQAVEIAMRAALKFIKRYQALAAEKALITTDQQRKAELQQLAVIFSDLLEGPVRSFYEAVETVYLVHLIMMLESNGHSFSFGRFDQYCYPYYCHDLETGQLTTEKALEIITHFFIKVNSLNKIRPWDHTQYSGGYPLYSNLMVGGMRPDGTDGTNALSYLCLEAMNLSRLPDPNLSVRFSRDTPESLLTDAAKLIRKGFGMPSLFCDEVVIKAMLSLGIPLADARDYCSIGCVEVGIQGKWGHRATGMTYINFGKILELVLYNGQDPKTKIQLLSVNGKPTAEIDYQTYDEVFAAWKKLLAYYLDLAVQSDLVCDLSLKHHDADPFASATIDCCMERGKTLKQGGAQYDFVSQSNIGPSTVGDSLTAIKKLVFDEKRITLQQLKTALEQNFSGPDGAYIRRLCLQAPKFGNDDDEADLIVRDVYQSYLELLPLYHTDRYLQGPIGGRYTMSTSNITSYVPNGFDVGATPDGRLATKPLNEGASPCLGADRHGPTAVINSMAKLPNDQIAGGQLLNMRFSPGALAGSSNLQKFVSFIRTAPYKNIFHNQFNVVDSATLRDAQAHPEAHLDLMVRVAGYCALFSTLMPEAQDAIIARTELDW